MTGVAKKHNNYKGYNWDGRLHNFYFIKPIPNVDADSLSEKLLGIKGVEEVHVTEGGSGFLVRAKYSAGAKDVGEQIAKSMNSRYNLSLSYYSFNKE